MTLSIQHFDNTIEEFQIETIDDLRCFFEEFGIPPQIIQHASSFFRAVELLVDYLNHHHINAWLGPAKGLSPDGHQASIAEEYDPIMQRWLEEHYPDAFVAKTADKQESQKLENFQYFSDNPLYTSDIESNFQLQSIIKALHPKDWNLIQGAHNPQYNKIVDHTFHAKYAPMHQEYQDFLSHPKTLKSVHSKSSKIDSPGMFPKLIHDIPQVKSLSLKRKSSRFMIKPYHQNVLPGIGEVTDKPLHGWSTMTMHALYHAGGIGHLVENVSMGEHQGIPITIHKFADPNMKAAKVTIHPEFIKQQETPGFRPSYHINGLNVQQIALMDFLTNNFDRHGKNLLVGNTIAQDGPHKGFNPILAIDHTLAFQYNRSIKDMRAYLDVPDNIESPVDYIRLSAPLRAAHTLSTVGKGSQALAEWWQKYGTAIRDTFYKHTQAIKSARIRRHLRKNFNDRWNLINQWATPNTPDNYQEISIFSPLVARRVLIKSIEPYSVNKKYVQRLRNNLPKDPYDAAIHLINITTNRPHTSKFATAVLTQLIKEMPTDTLRKFVRQHYRNPIVNIPVAINLSLMDGTTDEPRMQMLHEEFKKIGDVPLRVAQWKQHREMADVGTVKI